ncbi:MAG: metallophosphoesterase family protein [Pseudolabrys sp.]|nr:metallophosphoesterase family protein [Pseudolabrys sp.]MDP2295332.1 metallophosphoesterase family protein [Pseudolabrys sp.]
MLIACFADIHANRQAFEACLAHARDAGAERYVLLGDYVGYGADPDWAVTTVMDMVANGAMAVLGNHDGAVGTTSETMNAEAQMVIEWTRGQLSPAQRQFLADLPLTVQDESRLYVHAEASKPEEWIYVHGTAEAATSLAATPAHITFCGHVHTPALYSLSITGTMTAFTIASTNPIPLLPGRRWLAVLGSVGQPRDGNPAAAYTMLDTDKKEMTFLRVAYDIDEAAARIRKAGLPLWLAERLFTGQ